MAALLGAASLPLPFFSAATLGNVSAVAAHAGLPALALICAAAVVVAGDRRESLVGLPAIAAAATVTLAVLLTGALLIDAGLASREAAALGVEGSFGSGLWLMTGATTLSVAGLVWAMSRRLS
jgi:uncharacterized cupredoxin-like copper-binding protein